jgi:hypothetical protein
MLRRVPGRFRHSSVLRGYDTAQICVEGHIISMFAASNEERTQEHCINCGAVTVMECSHCHEPIRGHHHGPGIGTTPTKPPAFCHKCGNAYPWIEKNLAVGAALIDEMQGLSDSEKEALAKSLPDLVRDVPATEVAVVRFKKFLPKVGETAYAAFKAVLISVVTEEAKKKLGL